MGDLPWVSEDMFPDAKLPVPCLQASITSCEKLWYLKSLTLSCTPTAMTEAAIGIWLNYIISNLAAALQLNAGANETGSANCSFDSRTSAKGPAGGYKPDISVIDQALLHNSLEDGWHDIEVIIKVTPSAKAEDVLQ